MFAGCRSQSAVNVQPPSMKCAASSKGSAHRTSRNGVNAQAALVAMESSRLSWREKQSSCAAEGMYDLGSAAVLCRTSALWSSARARGQSTRHTARKQDWAKRNGQFVPSCVSHASPSLMVEGTSFRPWLGVMATL